MVDVVIIGAGPAGISAALYAKRANKNVLVIYNGESNLEKAEKIDNYYGFENGITGKELYDAGIRQAKNLGVEVKEEEVLNLELTLDGFAVKTVDNVYEAKTCIIATGNKKLRPNIDGILEFEGKGVSYCAICDGFFYRKKNVVVIGNGKFAVSEARDLENIVADVKILTDGKPMMTDSTFEIVDNKYQGLLYSNQIFQPLHTGDRVTAYIDHVRQDGKIDMTLQPTGRQHTLDFAEVLLRYLYENDGRCDLSDKSPAELIADRFKVSKKAYKKAVGDLYRRRLITISDEGIRLVT